MLDKGKKAGQIPRGRNRGMQLDKIYGHTWGKHILYTFPYKNCICMNRIDNISMFLEHIVKIIRKYYVLAQSIYVHYSVIRSMFTKNAIKIINKDYTNE